VRRKCDAVAGMLLIEPELTIMVDAPISMPPPYGGSRTSCK
jgi:hypothetical protein